ncbi:Receptor-like protein 12 [Rhynchospora pubera]|uniref:Receptor-like protein 12 n=1 Tax=Rhynchospora pubera TaxID=906938 RepID=A0AAV8C7Y4_9POAL|nr:Receptor-like protein 12 [Rhynchospora pubera]
MGEFYQFDFSTSLDTEIKGQDLYYSETLSLVKLLDLSSNNLSGDIPEQIISLCAVISLNLSRNHLNGEISKNIGEMQSLTSLDFSFNELDGPIPESLSNLTALSHLNLSYNNFSGEVPTGRQLYTFDSSSYVGNVYLCGPPTERKCSDGEANNTNFDMNEHAHGFEMIWLLVSIATGFVGGFWCVCGALLLKRTWRVAFFQMVDLFFDNMYVKIVLI